MIIKSRKEKLIELILKSNKLVKKAPDVNIEILKRFSVKELEEILETYELMLMCFANLSTKYISKLSGREIKSEYEIKKINLDDLLNSL